MLGNELTDRANGNRRLTLLLIGCLVCLSIGRSETAHAAPAGVDKLSPALRQAFAQAPSASYLVLFADNADLSGAPSIADKNARRQFVYERLRAQAQRTHAGARAILQGTGVVFREHYLLNALEVQSDLTTATQLAAVAGVTRVELNPLSRADLPVPQTAAKRATPLSPDSINLYLPLIASPGSPEWGVRRVHAPDVWYTYGVRGEGVVVGTADTGVQWDHPALEPHYRGWNGTSADHNYNWHDAVHDGPPAAVCGNDSAAPCDVYGHGTHVTGTMVGDDGAGNEIGVAPGAKWIGCRNMDNDGNGTPARYTECFEFMLAPYPIGGNPLTDGRPDLGADIINNSWTCPASEGCTTGDELHSEVQKLNAAGILVVAAAGNAGSACSSVDQAPATYAETFAAGATDASDNIAGFSSRGPVTVDGSNRRKPDVSAPGVNVRSSYPPSTYTILSGTSMASPHTSGVAALLWSGLPSLNGNITQTLSLIEGNADPKTTAQLCSTDTSTSVPNNVYGYGIVNALAAIQCAPTGLCFRLAASSSQVNPGDTLTYTLALSNSNSMSATNVIITDRVPLNTTYVPNSIGGTGADDSAAPLLRWNAGAVAPLAVSGTLTFTLRVTVNPLLANGSVISNTAWLSSSQSGPQWSNSTSAVVVVPTAVVVNGFGAADAAEAPTSALWALAMAGVFVVAALGVLVLAFGGRR